MLRAEGTYFQFFSCSTLHSKIEVEFSSTIIAKEILSKLLKTRLAMSYTIRRENVQFPLLIVRTKSDFCFVNVPQSILSESPKTNLKLTTVKRKPSPTSPCMKMLHQQETFQNILLNCYSNKIAHHSYTGYTRLKSMRILLYWCG